ncbi:MAG: hypothetical protein AB1752_12010 [Candidatus Zixiibacteriota bacterium]
MKCMKTLKSAAATLLLFQVTISALSLALPGRGERAIHPETDGGRLSETVPSDIVLANIRFPKPTLKKKQYSPSGEFLGCWGEGLDCVVIPLASGESLTLSSEGVALQ